MGGLLWRRNGSSPLYAAVPCQQHTEPHVVPAPKNLQYEEQESRSDGFCLIGKDTVVRRRDETRHETSRCLARIAMKFFVSSRIGLAGKFIVSLVSRLKIGTRHETCLNLVSCQK